MRLGLLLLLAGTLPASAEEAEWRNLYACLEQHIVDVASVVESVDEGAGLVVDVICVQESLNVANAMVNTRIGRVNDENEFGRYIESYRAVILREMRESIYFEKVRQR